jgi:hypothetical protein
LIDRQGPYDEVRKRLIPLIAIRTTKCFPLVFGRTINLNVSIQVTDRVFKATGLRLTVHQFRHVAAAIFIKAYPGQYERARQLLGHKHAWACPSDHYFEAHTKYLQLADKASRTVAMLTERLDQHRGRGHQQIVVKHVTVNADQAMVAESIVAGNVPRKERSLLPATGADRPMQILEPTQKEAVPTGGGTKSK